MQNHTKWVETPFRGNFAFRSRRQPPTTFRGASKHHFEALRIHFETSSKHIKVSIRFQGTLNTRRNELVMRSSAPIRARQLPPTRGCMRALRYRREPRVCHAAAVCQKWSTPSTGGGKISESRCVKAAIAVSARFRLSSGPPRGFTWPRVKSKKLLNALRTLSHASPLNSVVKASQCLNFHALTVDHLAEALVRV